MSSTQDLQWLLTRKNSSFLVKQKGLGRVFSREPLCLDNLHSFKSNFIVNDKAVGIQPAASGKGIAVTTKNAKAGTFKIGSARSVQIIKSGGSRRAAGSVANIVGKRGYRSDLLKMAVARTSAIHKSQRPGGRKQALGNRSRHQASRKPVADKKD
ncbi:hypothetical protein CBS101457_003506 [Exobasidium rhododendri]|nr:hypothetical protein CBS101457_003506 [Exobasidium rhododendri]